MGKLTTHVLDTANGKPAAGMRIVLFRLDPEPELLVDSRTNADGRTDGPLLEGDGLVRGLYELAFHVGDHFRAAGTALPDPAFLDVVPVRFGIADPEASYHVPLLASPYGYATYRGS
jgi:5-hydroxyisourate hydrolase